MMLSVKASGRRHGWRVLGGAALFFGMCASGAQTYRVGEVVEEFELVNRKPWMRDTGEVVEQGAPLRLSDFQGKIVFLEWFAYW